MTADCPRGPHQPPAGPNEDVSLCSLCGAVSFEMRPEDEQFGLHLDDCSLERRHNGDCVGGGAGHPVAREVRGYWITMDEDIAAARQRHGSI